MARNQVEAVTEADRMERRQRIIYGGYRFVFDPLRCALAEDLDLNAEYQFMREEWEQPWLGRLRDFHPASNMIGLYWRPLTSAEERV